LGTEQQNERILKQATKPSGKFTAFSAKSSVPSIMKGATRAARMKNDYEGDAGARVVTAPANIGLSV
jgi:hypothetical protein